MTDKTELKPCPICDESKARLSLPTCEERTPYDPSHRAYPIVRCGGCGAEAPLSAEELTEKLRSGCIYRPHPYGDDYRSVIAEDATDRLMGQAADALDALSAAQPLRPAVEAAPDLTETAKRIAWELHGSEAGVLDIFDRYSGPEELWNAMASSHREAYLSAARAVSAPAAAPGGVWMPLDPTPEMLSAMWHPSVGGEEAARRAYARLLSASPAAPAAQAAAKIIPYTDEDDRPDPAMDGLVMLAVGKDADEPDYVFDRIPAEAASTLCDMINGGSAPAAQSGESILWCAHVQGPDEVHPARDYSHAVEMCDMFNAISERCNFGFKPDDIRYVRSVAYPAIWPWGAASHAEGLASAPAPKEA
ncbi:hypothetical protein FBZ84_101124 [Azospirillum baldaniorum]|uniref:hypothetical protein n=1 Tax=Azospirillum baldaniorum TaxID=1064539 RepID=UPI0011A66C97|nr:hypothetical protein [Azospirillum baldaniorum]TWA71858.1 hypothetical protein FBZ84_101124 [Azospirillum baldaniorum]